MARIGLFEQYLDDNGDPLASGRLYFYEVGTTTPFTVYSDEAMSVAHSAPVVLDSAGRQPDIFYTGQAKLVIKDSADAEVETIASIGADSTSAASIRTLYLENEDTNALTDAEQTKLAGIATDANNYTHPNHTGDVTSTADGATTLQPNAIVSKEQINSLTDTDEFLVSDAGVLKRTDFSNIYGDLLNFDYTTLANGEYYGLAVKMIATSTTPFRNVAVKASSGDSNITSFNQTVESLAHALGLVCVGAGSGGGDIYVLTKGFIRSTTWSWTVGAPLYAATGTSLTETRPTTTNYYACRVGVAVTSDIVFVNPQDPIQI